MSRDEIKNLNKKELRDFGLTTGAIVAGLFGLALPWLFNHGFPRWPWIISLILWVWALLIPKTLNLLYRSWMKIGLMLGWVNTRIILSILFYTIFLPIGLVMRLAGKDPMSRALYKEGTDYRINSKQSEKERFRRPY